MPHIYQDILNSVQKPVRYLGNEWNVVRKSKEEARKRVALCFPDTYEIGMSHLGLRILYSILNKRQDTAAERVYTPWIDMEAKLRESGLPLVSMETQMPLSEFDVVGFSLQYELEYTNILTMLDLGRIPLYSKDREIEHPLVIGGGPCAFSPEPIADFLDCVLIGDGEEAFPAVVDRFIELREAGLSRVDILKHLANLDGIYVPSLYETKIDPETGFEVVVGSDEAPFPVKRTYVEDINDYPFPDDILVPHGDIVHDRVSIEIARGCTEGCRFCQAGTIYRPVRERKPEDIINTIMKSLEKTGFDQASLTSLSTADFSCIGPLAQKLSTELEKRQTALGVSSMRVYGMTDTLGESLSKVRRSGFTIAPEAGSQRMRDVINKGITEEVILGGADTAFRNGWSHVKLYFMIGLPTETEKDLKAIVDLGVKILKLAEQRHGKKAQVTISVSSHIPKPHAPFQWLGVEDQESLRQKQKYLLSLMKRYKRLRFKWHDVEHTWLEAIFSRGDRRLSKALELAYKKGCRFDAWTDQINLKIWREVFEELQIDTEMWMKDIPLYATLPWDHLDSLVKKDWLIRELKRAMKGQFSPACEKPYKKKSELNRTDLGKPEEDDKLVCYHCGLECDLDAIRKERIDSWMTLEKGIPIQIKEEVPELKGTVDKVTRYRASYCKLGEFRFLSALDLTRSFTRAFSRSRVPLKFSEGFHPAPIISFGPALGVGMESAEEFLDFETIVEIQPAKLLQMLNAQMPEGLRFQSLQIIDRKADALFKIISAAEYSVLLDSDDINAQIKKKVNGKFNGNLADLHQSVVTDLLNRDTIEIEKISKGRTRVQDIKPLINKLEVVNSKQPLHLRMILSTGSQGNVRPEAVLKQMYSESADLLKIKREKLFVEKKGEFYSPFE
ncbi:TIGR03960 family B12-binding radical SAM protein [candidate division KSB1 bacterium]|nr:TIGR03960 family B12-binding radical SAM protein [candidate division KSB1 bacterium]